MPGLIDPHVHVNQPGDVSEGFYTATRAAAAGGTTTILDMPLNSIPCTLDRESFHQKYQELNISQPAVDVGFIGGITPENMEHIKELMDEGVISLKSFMVDSQTKEFVHVEKHDLEQAVDILHEMATKYYPKAAPIPYMLHAEIPIVDKQDDSHMKMYDHKSYIDYEASRPSTWELEAVQLALRSANNSRVHIYIAHVSSHDVVEYIKDIHFNKGLKEARVSLETCPHYLVWASDEIESGNTLLKCSPPMRDSSNRGKLLETLFNNSSSIDLISVVASDHSPCIAALKQTEGNLTNAWGGISGLQYRLQGTWTAAKKGGVSVAKLVNLLSEGPARKFGLDKLKGSLKEGLDADMVVWDPNVKVTLSPETCHHREKASAFHGDTVDGRIEYTLLRGQGVFSRRNEGIGGEFGCCKDSYGRLLRRQAETGIVF